MTTRTPRADFDSRYSDPQASHTDWQPAREVLATTELSWLTTVRPDGRPHTTPADHRLARRRRPLLYRTGGTQAQNLDANPTWCWQPARTLIPMAWMWCSRVRPYRSGTGKSSQIWQRLGWLSTGGEWRFDVAAGGFRHSSGEGVADVFRIEPRTAFAFGKNRYRAFRFD